MLTFKSFINEARRRPDLNPKISVNEFISNHLDNSRPLRNTSVANSFVNFTNFEYTGPNVNPGYKTTPIGIYAYPSEYVMRKAGPDRPMREALPYAADAEYANIFSVKGNIVDLGKVSASEVKEYYQSVTDVYLEYRGTRRGTEQWKEDIDYLELDIFMAAPSYADVASPGGRLWWVTKTLSKIMMEEDVDGNLTKRWGANNLISSWRKLLLEAGIDGAIDSKGQGIIHTNEPTQAVFFSRRSIDKNNRVYNKYSPEDMEKAETFGSKIALFKSVDPDEMAKHIIDNPDEIRSDIVTEPDFIGALHPLDPKIQAALLHAFLAHPLVLDAVVETNAHVFSGVSDSDIINVVDKAKSKAPAIMSMINAGLIRQDNITPKIVNALIESKLPISGIAYTIRHLNPSLIEPIISMAKINDQNISRFFELGAEYFAGMRGADIVVDRMIDFGNALVNHAGGNESKIENAKALIKIIISGTLFDEDDSAEVMDAVFGD